MDPMTDDPGLDDLLGGLPPDPCLEQKAALVRDLIRLRDLASPYLPGAGGDYRKAVACMPAAAGRAECEQILDRTDTRIGPRNRAAAAQEEQLLHRLASLELDLLQTVASSKEPEAVQNARNMLSAVERWRNKIAGLDEE
jgi:hypothetical protein